jgi:hypothetical protein
VATLSRGQTLGATETVTNTKLHNLVDQASVSNIVNADCASDMALVDTKLSDITTGGKVRGTAISNLASIPTGAGVVPFANISLTSIPNPDILPLTLTSWVDGASLRNLASIPSGAGQFNYDTIVSSLASGGLAQFDGVNSFIGTNIQDLASGNSDVVFCACIGGDYTVDAHGLCIDDSITAANTSITKASWCVYQTTYRSILKSKFKKKTGSDTLTVYARIWQHDAANPSKKAQIKVILDAGALSGTTDGSGQQTTPEWVNFTIDVSSLTDDTVYDLDIQISHNNDAGGRAYMDSIIIFGS